MKISTMESLRRPILFVLIPAFLSLVLVAPIIAQEKYQGQGRIENAKFALVGSTIIITYDLVANTELTYDVSVVLRRDSDRNFGLVPKTLSGAIGKGKYAGVGREIRWDIKKDIPEGLKGADYHFEFLVQIIKEEEGSNLWYYLAAGAILVGGGVVYALLGGKSSSPSGLPEAPKVEPTSQ